MKTNRKSVSPLKILLCFLLFVYAAVLLILIYWGLITSVKTEREFTVGKNNFLGFPIYYRETRGGLLAPWDWAWSNFKQVYQLFTVRVYSARLNAYGPVPFPIQIYYTLFYSLGCSFFATLCPCIVAYATQKFKYGFNRVIDIIVIICMTVPIIGSQASMLSLMHGLDIYDTFPGLYMQKFNFGNMYYLMFSAIFKGISKEYYEAGYIDGASEWQVMVKISIPLVMTSFGLVFLLNFITYWNDYSTLLIYAPSHPTVMLGLFKIMTERREDQGEQLSVQIPYVVQMAGCTLVVLPVLIVFIIFRNKLMGNLTLGGVKE